PYLELQTSKLYILGGYGKLRQISTTSFFGAQPGNTRQFGVKECATSRVVNEQPPPSFRQQQPVQQNNSSPSLEDLNVFAKSKELQTQIGQLATIVNQLQSKGYEQILSQTILSPQANMSVITLRSGNELPQQQTINMHSEFPNFDVVAGGGSPILEAAIEAAKPHHS
ncbi:hypothetical protein CR513_22557, partial [Mucuna pruriens]